MAFGQSSLNSFPLGPFTEDIFETMACYFPIDFTPPQGLAQSVTKDDLVQALRSCLSYHVSFASHAIPLFVEKLESDLDSAKLDANLSLLQCLKSGYQPEHLAPFIHDLWQAYKKEIMGIRLKTSPPEVNLSSLGVLSEITKVFSSSIQTPENRSVMEKWLEMIWDDCGRHLNDIELKLMSLTVDILAALCNQTGDYSATFVLSKSMPVILQTMSKANETSKRITCLSFISKILAGTSSLNQPDMDWIDSYVYQCNLAITSSEKSYNEEGCLALANGIHLLKLQVASDALDHLLKPVFDPQGTADRWLPNKRVLVEKLCLKLKRPDDEEITKMFNGLQSQNSNNLLSIMFEITCKNVDLLKVKILPKVDDLLRDPCLWLKGAKILTSVWELHHDLAYFMKPSSTAFGKVIKNSAGSEPSVATEIQPLIKSISRVLSQDHVGEIAELLSPFFQESNQTNFWVAETMLCFISKGA